MSKDHSEQETKITPNKYSVSKKTSWILEQTRQALDYYSKTKKNQLIKTKQSYFQRIDHNLSQSVDSEVRSRRKRRKNRKKKNIVQPVRKPERVSHRQEEYYKEPQLESVTPINEPEEQVIRNDEQNDQSSLSSVGKYELRPVHEVILQMQKTIDSYLQFQYTNRKKRSITREQLFSFLTTTRYAISGKRYFEHLLIYNSNLYNWNQTRDRLFCHNYTNQLINKRYEQTKQRMTQKSIAALLV